MIVRNIFTGGKLSASVCIKARNISIAGKSIFNKFVQSLQRSKQRDTLYYLRCMPERQLIDCGFSPYLVSEGLKGWPWRLDSTTYVSPTVEQLPKTAEEEQHVEELQRYSDAELADLGISRGTIRDSVRHGRLGIERIMRDKAA